MGPSSLAQIKALNKLTTPELDSYVSLWQTKHAQAKTEAVSELEGLRIETANKIVELNSDAQIELAAYRQTWQKEMATLAADTDKQLSKLKTDWLAKVGTLRTE